MKLTILQGLHGFLSLLLTPENENDLNDLWSFCDKSNHLSEDQEDADQPSFNLDISKLENLADGKKESIEPLFFQKKETP